MHYVSIYLLRGTESQDFMLGSGGIVNKTALPIRAYSPVRECGQLKQATMV